MLDYSVKVVESSKELTKKETVMFKDLSDAINLSELIASDKSLNITVSFFVRCN